MIRNAHRTSKDIGEIDLDPENEDEVELAVPEELECIHPYKS